MATFPLQRAVPKGRALTRVSLAIKHAGVPSNGILACFALLSLAFAVIMPPFQFNDEDGHFVRAFELSRGRLLGIADPRLPASVVQLLREFPEQLDVVPDSRWHAFAPWKIPVAKVTAKLSDKEELPSQADQALPSDQNSGHKYLRWAVGGANVYCPVVYAPAALGISVARVFRLPPLLLVYAARIFNALTVLAALAFALRIVPGYRVLFAAVALLPMTLSQSAAISADSVTIACSLVAFAMLLRVREVPITNAFLSALLIVFAVWGLCKTSLWALPLVLLVPPSLFTSRRRWLGYLVGVAVAMIAAVALWQLVAAADMRAFAALRRQGGIHTSASLFWLLSHPLHFGWWMIRVIHAHYPAYLHQFVGGFGWMWIGLRLRYQIPALVVLALSILAVHSGKPFSTRERILLLAVFIGALSFIHAILFVTDGSPPPSAPASFQGRYIIPFSLAGLLAFVPDKPVIPVRIGAVVVVLSGVIYGLSSLILIASSYYL